MAIENAVEGCVKETFAAAVALVQAQTAADPEMRTTFRRIAIDELRHAELSWAVARWLDTRLTVADRRQVLRARQRAERQVIASAASDPDRELVQHLGLPTAKVALGIARDLSAALWSDR
jgi:hypothetical protein